MRKMILTLALGLATIAGAVQAKTISFYSSADANAPNGVTKFKMPKFDPRFGTLTSAYFYYEGEVIDRQSSFTLAPGSKATVIAHAELSITLGSLSFGSGEINSQTCTAPDTNEGCYVDADAYAWLSNLYRPIAPLDPILFSGRGYVYGESYIIGNMSRGLSFQLDYNYEPFVSAVPLPAGGGLLMVGLGGLAMLRRKRAA